MTQFIFKNWKPSNSNFCHFYSQSQLEELEEDEKRRKRMEEMRRRLNTEEVEEPPADENSQSDSQTSSVEGLYGACSGRTSHPFKVVDHDALSLQSGVSMGGRLGRLPGGSSSNHTSSSTVSTVPQLPAQDNYGTTVQTTTPVVSSSSEPQTAQTNVTVPPIKTCQVGTEPVPSSNTPTGETSTSNIQSSGQFIPEPDIVSSCKDKSTAVEEADEALPMKAPVAPPRRKRKGNDTTASRSKLNDFGSIDDVRVKESVPEHSAVLSRQGSRLRDSSETSSVASFSATTPPSPTVSIRSYCRDMDKQLESPTQKIWIVKAQDEEKTRAKSSGPKVLRRTESLPKDVIAAFEPSGTGSGGTREKESSSKSNSNSNSSTLNNTSATSTIAVENVVPVPSPAGAASTSTPTPVEKPNGRDPGNHNLSTLISAMAALEERREAELQLNLNLRTRTDSGKFLSDMEILEQVEVMNFI